MYSSSCRDNTLNQVPQKLATYPSRALICEELTCFPEIKPRDYGHLHNVIYVEPVVIDKLILSTMWLF